MEVSIQFAVLVPVVLGVVQVFKVSGLDSRWAPLVSLALGVLGTYAISGFNSFDIIQGLIAGLSASGLWSGTKASFTPSV